MRTIEVAIPDELLDLLKLTRLGSRPPAEQMRVALAVYLFQEDVISAGRAAELAGEPRAAFELMLAEMGVPALRYDVPDYEQDREAIRRAKRT